MTLVRENHAHRNKFELFNNKAVCRCLQQNLKVSPCLCRPTFTAIPGGNHVFFAFSCASGSPDLCTNIYSSFKNGNEKDRQGGDCERQRGTEPNPISTLHSHKAKALSNWDTSYKPPIPRVLAKTKCLRVEGRKNSYLSQEVGRTLGHA